MPLRQPKNGVFSFTGQALLGLVILALAIGGAVLFIPGIPRSLEALANAGRQESHAVESAEELPAGWYPAPAPQEK